MTEIGLRSGRELGRGISDTSDNFAIKGMPDNRGEIIHLVVNARTDEFTQPPGQHASQCLLGIWPRVTVNYETVSGEVLITADEVWGEFGEA